MQANELRIGNYYHNHGEIEKITPNTILEVWRSKRSWCKPILLTEEWLLKFGFEKIENANQYGYYLPVNNRTLCWGYDDFISIEFKPGQMDEFNSTLIDMPCKYIHQLQNLYFALTGEELIINT